MVGIQKLFFQYSSPTNKVDTPLPSITKKGRFFVFGETAKKIMAKLVSFANVFYKEKNQYSIVPVKIGDRKCFVIRTKGQSAFRANEGKQLKVATANMGEDADLGVVNKLKEQNKIGGHAMPLHRIRNEANAKVNMKNLEPEHRDILNTISRIGGIQGKLSLQELKLLVDFFGDPKKSNAFLNDFHDNSINEKFPDEQLFKDLVSGIFTYYTVEQAFPDSGKKVADNQKKRIDGLSKQDVCFLQECDPNSMAAIPGMLSVGEHNVILLNRNRFDVLEPMVSSIVTKEWKRGAAQLEDNNSFVIANGVARGVLVQDKETGRKMLLCSCQIAGYGIGNKDEERTAADEIRTSKELLKKIAEENGIDDIIWGGDFNSVQEDVNGIESPLKAMDDSFVAVECNQNTEVPPIQFRASQQHLMARRIDHIFFSSKVGMAAEPAVLPEGPVDVANQWDKVYDHGIVETTFRV